MSEHVTEFIDAYALEELDADTSAAVRHHLSRCAVCRAQYNDARAVLDLLPQALEPVKPHDRVLRAILANATPSERGERPQARSTPRVAFAAALLLAVVGDVVLGVLLTQRHDRIITAVVTPAPRPASTTAGREPPHRAAPVAVHGSPPKHVLASPRPAILPPPHIPAPAASGLTVTPSPRSSTDSRLVHERDQAIEALRVRSTLDAGRIAQLEHRLAIGKGGNPRETALLTALQSGSVHAIEGTVDGQAWHCTVLQSSPTSNALLVTATPDAPAGEQYRVWVLRDKHIYDAGSLAPHASLTLEMPMPLQRGDVVAFSREPLATGSAPTRPYLMELPISN